MFFFLYFEIFKTLLAKILSPICTALVRTKVRDLSGFPECVWFSGRGEGGGEVWSVHY